MMSEGFASCVYSHDEAESVCVNASKVKSYRVSCANETHTCILGITLIILHKCVALVYSDHKRMDL